MKLPPGHVPGVGLVAATARGGLGERLLRKYGWSDGDGLGVERQGRATPVETKQKADNSGIGARAPSFDWGDAWWERAFDGAAKSIDPKAAAAYDSSDSSSSSSSDRGLTTHRDGMATTATRAEMKLAARLARDKWGRFGGRDGKMARIAAMEAAAAEDARRKLDGGAQAAPPATSKPAPDADGGRPSKKAKKGKSKSTNKRKDASPPSPPAADAPPPYTPPQGWWGAATFVHAGRLEGLDDPRLRTERRGFTEADQEAAATGGVARGDKRGLGAASAKKLGRDWAGTKTTFGDDEKDSAPPPTIDPPPTVKWRKLAAAVLASKPVRLDKLVKKVVAAAVDKHGAAGVEAAGGAAAARSAVQRSSKFATTDGRVALAKQ